MSKGKHYKNHIIFFQKINKNTRLDKSDNIQTIKLLIYPFFLRNTSI